MASLPSSSQPPRKGQKLTMSKDWKRTSSQPLTSTADKAFQKALKELGVPTKCPVKPNLNAKRKRLNTTPEQQACLPAAHATFHSDLDGDSWTTPKRPLSPQTLSRGSKDDPSIITHNQFDALATLDTNEVNLNLMDIEGPESTSGHPTYNTNPSTFIETTNNTQPIHIRSKIRPPPIYCIGISIKNLLHAAKDNIPCNCITLKDIGNDTISINITSMEHYNSMKETLGKIQAKFYTFTPNHLKNKLLVLKGIQGDFNENDIKEEITGLDLQDIQITNISRIKLGKHENAPTHFLVQLSPESIPSNLTKQKTLACQRIRWEPYRKNNIFQCKNCQRVGHSSANCSLGYRCVKCLDNYEPGKCMIIKNNNESHAACVNPYVNNQKYLRCSITRVPGYPPPVFFKINAFYRVFLGFLRF